jgi:hypothetical protein
VWASLAALVGEDGALPRIYLCEETQMSEEKVELPLEEEAATAAEEQAVVPSESEGAKPDIAHELQELGHQLTNATKAVLESPEAQEVGAQLQRGLESLEKTVSQLVGQARETKVGKRVETSVSEAATTVKERGVLDTLAESVASALQTVNQTLGQAVEKAQARTEEAKAKRSAPQQIEVVADEEQAAAETETGEE